MRNGLMALTRGSFVELLDKLGLDSYRLMELADHTIGYIKGMRDEPSGLQQLWYASLAAGEPDASIYDGEEYIAEAWACWAVYSQKYLRAISKPTCLANGSIVDDVGQPRLIVDLGCGVGFTTAALARLFPNAEVIGTNSLGSWQASIASNLAEKYDFKLSTDARSIGRQADLVFASEYFEHWQQPVKHLLEAIEALSPRAMLVANAFGARSPGHFDRYVVKGMPCDARQASLAFNYAMRDRGYVKQLTRLWNQRPTYWKVGGELAV